MNLQRHIRTFLLLTSFAATTMLTGCELSVGNGDDGDGGDDEWQESCDGGQNNRIDSRGDCVCEFGYDWCTPDAQNTTLMCCELGQNVPCDDGSNNHKPAADRCECNDGFQWCDSKDSNNLHCCPIPDPTTTGSTTTGGSDASTTTGGEATTGGDMTTGVDTTGTDGMDDTGGDDGDIPPDPTLCTDHPDDQGMSYCSKTLEQGPLGSKYYLCEAGVWVDKTATLDGECQYDGADFAFGCVDNPDTEMIELVCGVGPGEICDVGQASTCASAGVVEKCVDGRTVHENCDPQNGGQCEVDGMQHEFGECQVENGSASCVCWDDE